MPLPRREYRLAVTARNIATRNARNIQAPPAKLKNAIDMALPLGC
jgi:hypothetical protein